MTAEDDLLDRVLDITVLAMRSVDHRTCEDHNADPALEWFRAGIAYTAGSLLYNLGTTEPSERLTIARVVKDGFAAMAGRIEAS